MKAFGTRFRHCFLFMAILIVGCGGLSSCATGQRFRVVPISSSGDGAVYLYRKFVWDGMGTSPTILLNGKPQGYLKNAGYMCFELPPGRYVLDTQGNNKWEKHERPLRFFVRSGELEYIKLDTERMIYTTVDLQTGEKIGRSDPQFVKVNRITAMRELKGLRASN